MRLPRDSAHPALCPSMLGELLVYMAAGVASLVV